MSSRVLLAATAAALLLGGCAMRPAGNSPSFFVTSANPGKGADFGGLEGADRYCQALGTAAGAGQRTWRAYLSATASGNAPAVNARDRIGTGPWFNTKGTLIAYNLNELHTAPNISKQTALTEKGEMVSGRGDAVNLHDILTGSKADGTVATGTGDTTCRNWTSSTDGSAIVGHHDRMGLSEDAPAKSWNASHPTRGCSLDALKSTGGGGRLYCFAAN